MTNSTKNLSDKLIVTKCGDTIFVYIDETSNEVNKEIETKMRKEGTSRIERDGTTIFFRDQCVFDFTPNLDEVDRYIWSKDGNRVKFARHRITTKDGEIINDEITKHVFKNL